MKNIRNNKKSCTLRERFAKIQIRMAYCGQANEEQKKMKLSLRIPLTLTMIVFMTGIITMLNHAMRGKPYPTSFLIIWIVGSVVLSGITFFSWQRDKKN
jgi:hypothetical protein